MGLKYTRMAKKFVWMGDKMKAIVVTKEKKPLCYDGKKYLIFKR